MVRTLGAMLIVVAVAVGGAIVLSARSPAAHEIRLVTRDMTFYLEGQVEPNPTLRLRAGEKVRLVLRNEDAGMTHDFAVPGWQAVTKRIEGGESASISFRAPEQPTSLGYVCRPHAAMMRGMILVE